ncbi:DDE_Tnp_IS1595 domain-containing protein, partial [Caerostris darwini]
KTVLLDETFVTRRKYNRGRVTATMTQTVFVIFCKEDREGLFFLVDGKKKRHLRKPREKICPSHDGKDEAAQYEKVDRLMPGVIHKTTNHSKGGYVAKDDKSNTINPLENENNI